MAANRVRAVGTRAIKGVAALGWVSFFSVICAGCSGLPLLAGVFGGVAVTTRFGVSAGAVTFVFVAAGVVRRRRAARRACTLPNAQASAD
jgi:hypothetical protein